MSNELLTVQITQPFVGNVVELFYIDLTPIGQNVTFAFTPSSEVPIAFNGVNYFPAPIQLTGIERNQDSAPGRIQMAISNLTLTLAAAVVSYGDLVGANVTYTRTFENYLDGKPNGGTAQQFPSIRMHIFQMDTFTRNAIQFTLATELDRPSLMLPRRQALKSAQGKGILWAPGLSRSR